ncbi:MAG TPA: DmsE family decaheme c-type cytochrome [Acidobacteriota bacterium]|nr:DmsE family decaheme c-type cytochrome [Acidobacteriota bacterium]
MKLLLLALMVLTGLYGPQEEDPAEVVTPERIGREMCLACHEVHAQFQRSPHGLAECEDCHGPGSQHVETMDDSLSFRARPPAWVIQRCQSCHRADDQLSAFVHSPHGRNDVDCTSCHEIHVERVAFDLLRTDRSTELCVECHQATRADFRKPFHHPVLEGGMECIDCHNPHMDEGRDSMLRRTVGPGNGCVDCHAEVKGPFVFEHAPVKASDCTSCHRPHGSFNAKMLVRHQVHQLCLECHSLSADLFALQPPAFHDIRSPRFQNCTTCHRLIHGSNVSPAFLR